MLKLTDLMYIHPDYDEKNIQRILRDIRNDKNLRKTDNFEVGTIQSSFSIENESQINLEGCLVINQTDHHGAGLVIDRVNIREYRHYQLKQLVSGEKIIKGVFDIYPLIGKDRFVVEAVEMNVGILIIPENRLEEYLK